MPGKSQRSRNKRSSHSKKRRGNLPKIRQQPELQTSLSETPKAPKEPTIRALPTAVRNPYVTAELRIIGILAAIILTILVAVSFILF